MTNGFHYDSVLNKRDESEMQQEGAQTESATCVAEEPAELENLKSDIDFDGQA